MTKIQSKPHSEHKARPKPMCPICQKPTVERYRPFCSKRCSDLDLGRWLNGAYTIPDHGPVPEDTPLDGGGNDD